VQAAGSEEQGCNVFTSSAKPRRDAGTLFGFPLSYNPQHLCPAYVCRTKKKQIEQPNILADISVLCSRGTLKRFEDGVHSMSCLVNDIKDHNVITQLDMINVLTHLRPVQAAGSEEQGL
jgi:hypothetical protein